MPTRSRVRLRNAIQEQLDELKLPRGRGPWSQERLHSLRAEVARQKCERIARAWQPVEAASGDGIYVQVGGTLYRAPCSEDPIVVQEIMTTLNEKGIYRRAQAARGRWFFADGPIVAKRLVREHGGTYKLVTI